MKQILKYPLLLAFFGFVFFFAVYDLTQTNKVFSEFENRYLQQRPKFSFKTLMNNTYTKKYEEYINDQFVLRDSWIALKSMSESALGKIENNGITYGKDGYMFEKYKVLNEEQLAKNTQFIREFLELYPEKPITFGIVPNSYMFLAEKVPQGLGNIDQFARMDEVTGQLPGGTAVLDLRPILKEHSGEEIFYRTDHHWTTLGAYYGYSTYVTSLGLTPVPFEELEGRLVEDFYGTYFNKSKKVSARPDTITYYDIPVKSVTIDGKEYDGYYDLEKFEERDKYAAFLRGNNGYTVLVSDVNRDHREGETTKVLVVKDSYGNSLVPYLLYNFDEVHVVDLRAIQTKMSVLLEENQYQDILVLYNFMNFASDTNIFKLRS